MYTSDVQPDSVLALERISNMLPQPPVCPPSPSKEVYDAYLAVYQDYLKAFSKVSAIMAGASKQVNIATKPQLVTPSAPPAKAKSTTDPPKSRPTKKRTSPRKKRSAFLADNYRILADAAGAAVASKTLTGHLSGVPVAELLSWRTAESRRVAVSRFLICRLTLDDIKKFSTTPHAQWGPLLAYAAARPKRGPAVKKGSTEPRAPPPVPTSSALPKSGGEAARAEAELLARRARNAALKAQIAASVAEPPATGAKPTSTQRRR